MKQIKVICEPQYGRWVYYPACEAAQAFAAIAGTRTLTGPTLAQVKKLGYEVEVRVKCFDTVTQPISQP